MLHHYAYIFGESLLVRTINFSIYWTQAVLNAINGVPTDIPETISHRCESVFSTRLHRVLWSGGHIPDPTANKT